MAVPTSSAHFLSPMFDPAAVALIVPHQHAPRWLEPLIVAVDAARRPVFVVRDGVDEPPPGRTCDLAVIAVEHPRVAHALALAGRLRARAAVILADPPSAADTARWCEVARAHGMRLLGPGSAGFVRPHDGLVLGPFGETALAGDVALVSQSGALASALLDWADEAGAGFSIAVALGAEADVDIAQVLDFLATDRHTRSVIVYLESVRDVRGFLSALRVLASVRPVIVLKGQRFDEARPALTHAAAVAGPNAVYEAALRRAGVVQVQIFAQIEITARYLASRPGEVGHRLGVVSLGSGPAFLALDQAIASGLEVPSLSARTRQELARALPDTTPGNPLACRPTLDAAGLRSAIDLFIADPAIDALLLVFEPYRVAPLRALTDALIERAASAGKPVFACFMGARQVREHARRAEVAGIPVFTTPEAAVNAYANLAAFHYNQKLLLQTPRPLSGLDEPDLKSARMIVDQVLAQGRSALTEPESHALLRAFHVPVVPTRVARDPDEAVALAREIGYPVALKVLSSQVVRKSEVGGVALHLRDDADVREQYARIVRGVGEALPQARVDGMLVQSMRTGRAGRELYVGVHRDPLWGPVILFGAGGTRVEITRDVALELPPLNRFLARRMIERTRIHRLLGAYRELPPIDFEALERVLMRVSEMVCELPELIDMDINPLIADQAGVTVVDARIAIDRVARAGTRYAHMAIMPYPSHLERMVRLREGQACTIRPILPEDADALQAFVRQLSPEARHFRFVSTLSELPPRMLVRFTQIDYSREIALVAILEENVADAAGIRPGRIVGVARYMLNPDRQSSEFAVVIDDELQGQGLGSRLMRSIIEVARARGLDRIEGFVLTTNRNMLALMRHLGFRIQSDPQDPDMCWVWMDLCAEPAPDQPAP